MEELPRQQDDRNERCHGDLLPEQQTVSTMEVAGDLHQPAGVLNRERRHAFVRGFLSRVVAMSPTVETGPERATAEHASAGEQKDSGAQEEFTREDMRRLRKLWKTLPIEIRDPTFLGGKVHFSGLGPLPDPIDIARLEPEEKRAYREVLELLVKREEWMTHNKRAA